MDEIKDPEILEKERLAKQMNQVVCICKGINLGRVLKGIKHCDTVAEVNQAVGTGNGGCQGRRCGPRIKALLKRIKESKEKAKNSGSESTEQND